MTAAPTVLRRLRPFGVSGRRSAVLALLAGLVSVDATAAGAEAAGWRVLDDMSAGQRLHRIEAREGSVRREGVWAFFDQRLRIGPRAGGPGGMVETRDVAVNCYTGAWGYRTQRTQVDGVETRSASMSLVEIERMSTSRVPPTTAPGGAGFAGLVVQFACGCAQAGATADASGADVAAPPTREAGEARLAFYETVVRAQPTPRRFRLGYLRVKSAEQARELVAQLDAGADFAQLADRHSETRNQFPGGDLGLHEASRWPVADIRRFEALAPGEHTRTPKDAAFGSEIHKLIEVVDAPVPSFAQAEPQIAAYLAREALCRPGAR